jgi:glycosyltransferase involved in cell wall biosynthesis
LSRLRVAIVEAIPYEASWGGDGVYLDGIRHFLTSNGCNVTTFVTDAARGRRKPWVRLRTHADPLRHRWKVKGAVTFGAQAAFCLHPLLIRNTATHLLGRRSQAHDDPTPTEHCWVERQLREWLPDIVIYYLGAASILRSFDQPWKSVALGGWLRSRWIEAGSSAVAPASPRDRALIDAMRGADLAAFNNQADIDFFAGATGGRNAALWGMSFPPAPPLSDADEPVVLYVAADTEPNQRSLDWLLQGAWPQIRAASPDARLRIVGTVARRRVADPEHGIEFCGFVETLAEEYQRAQVVVAPIRAGTHGAKTKVAEALSFGRPLVTTSVGIDRGAPDRLGEAVDIADDGMGFATAVIGLLGDPKLRQRRNAQAREAYRATFAQDVAFASLRSLLADVSASPRGAASISLPKLLTQR